MFVSNIGIDLVNKNKFIKYVEDIYLVFKAEKKILFTYISCDTFFVFLFILQNSFGCLLI